MFEYDMSPLGPCFEGLFSLQMVTLFCETVDLKNLVGESRPLGVDLWRLQLPLAMFLSLRPGPR